MKDLLSNVGSGGGAAAAPAAGGAAAGGAAEAEAEAPKEEGRFITTTPHYDRELTHGTEKEESDDDMGFGLFD